jgi:hypothetical protein
VIVEGAVTPDAIATVTVVVAETVPGVKLTAALESALVTEPPAAAVIVPVPGCGCVVVVVVLGGGVLVVVVAVGGGVVVVVVTVAGGVLVVSAGGGVVVPLDVVWLPLPDVDWSPLLDVDVDWVPVPDAVD